MNGLLKDTFFFLRIGTRTDEPIKIHNILLFVDRYIEFQFVISLALTLYLELQTQCNPYAFTNSINNK